MANHPQVTSGPNIRFAPSHRIVPSFHVGPRAYAAGNIILHPLHGQIANAAQPRANAAPAGHGSVQDLMQSYPHPYTVNGRAPG